MGENKIARLKRLENLIANKLPGEKRKHTIVLNPQERGLEFNESEGIVYDKARWNLPEELKGFIEGLSLNTSLGIEGKMLRLYEKICTGYVYDDNLISYIKKDDEGEFTLPDWYGREVGEDWENKRKKHNRRVCFELARYLASGLTEMVKDCDTDYEIGIFWNKGMTHYLVGLTCDGYSVALDPDDFNNIKDLTRIKRGLTAQGIVILEDKDRRFSTALQRFNSKRKEVATDAMQEEIDSRTDLEEIEGESENVTFFRKAVEILSRKPDEGSTKKELESQGIFELVKEMADIKLGPEYRTKVYREIFEEGEKVPRRIRCLVLNIDGKKYLVDGLEKVFREFDEKEYDEKPPIYVKCKEATRDAFDYYDGR